MALDVVHFVPQGTDHYADVIELGMETSVGSIWYYQVGRQQLRSRLNQFDTPVDNTFVLYRKYLMPNC